MDLESRGRPDEMASDLAERAPARDPSRKHRGGAMARSRRSEGRSWPWYRESIGGGRYVMVRPAASLRG